ncbi:MAG TPA: permease [Actinomycetota bacterium]|nr:permease [Actinomycetota bacterium]
MQTPTRPETSTRRRAISGLPTAELVGLLLVAAVLFRDRLQPLFSDPAVRNWVTIFVAITIQALPFLVLGVVISGAIAAFVPPSWLARVLPANPVLSVPMASAAGMALPGCECGSVPIAGRLVARGAPAPAAMAFLLAAPAINPVVLVATAVAFPGRPQVVAARFLASFLTAVLVGLIWAKVGPDALMDRARRRVVAADSRWGTFAGTAHHDFLHAGGFLVVGGITAATLQTVVPRSVLDTIAGSGILAVATMAVLAVVLAICSEADAFVAASMWQFSLTSRLVFLVVGPAVDIKLVALQAGVFGRSFALRFAPLAFFVAVASALAVGWVLL